MMKKIKNKIVAFVKGDESNGRIKWSLYGRVWREIGQPYWKWLAAGIIFTILAAGAEAYTITIVQQVVDKAFIEKSLTAIYWLGVQVIVAFGAKGAFTYAKALIMSKGGLLASANLQKKIYKHMTHMNLARARAALAAIGARRSFLIHMSHDVKHAEFSRRLPRGVKLAYDGLKVRV